MYYFKTYNFHFMNFPQSAPVACAEVRGWGGTTNPAQGRVVPGTGTSIHTGSWSFHISHQQHSTLTHTRARARTYAHTHVNNSSHMQMLVAGSTFTLHDCGCVLQRLDV